MKTKIKLFGAILFLITSTLIWSGCGNTSTTPNGGNNGNGNKPTPEPEFAAGKEVTINGAEFTDENDWTFWTYDLKDYKGQEITIDFSVYMAVENSSDAKANFMWQVNMGADAAEKESQYPIIASHEFDNGKTDWTKVSGTKSLTIPNKDKVLYLSIPDTAQKYKYKIYLKNISIKINGDEKYSKIWTTMPSLKEAYVDSGIFDHFGLAVERGEIYTSDSGTTKIENTAKGLKHHVNSISMGNEMKPQWLLWYYDGAPTHTKDFTASNGKTIKVPNNIPSTGDPAHGFGGLDSCLQYCKDLGIQMRGHVLTWHSQTFDWFFCKDYDVNQGLLTDKDEMTARHEWYIKSVLEHVDAWEKANNGGKHIIYTWDVLNESVGDDASKTHYYRGDTPGTKTPSQVKGGCNSTGDSRWWQIYGSNEFIINAFRFANKYAPADVTLCYNDYNEYLDYGGDTDTTHKRTGIIELLKAVKNDTGITDKDGNLLKARIDAMAMQSHIESFVSVTSVETTINEFLKLGLDIQVTELDYKWNESFQDGKKGNFDKPLADIYSEYFKLYQKYAKSNRSGQNGITSVTIWGIEDAKTWLNKPGETYSPLLFTRDSDNNLIAKDAFFAVIDAAGKTE